jgi:putative ABC transport system permease protein
VRPGDLVKLGLSALWRQKSRTALTTLGVVIGSLLLILSLAISQGVKKAIADEFARFDQLRKVIVYPSTQAKAKAVPKEDLEVKGNISEEKRARLREAILRRYRPSGPALPRQRLTREKVKELEELPHVLEVVPVITRPAWVSLGGKGQSGNTVAAGQENRPYRSRVIAGRYLSSSKAREVVVSEYLLYRWGVVEDDQVEATLGRTVRLEFHERAPSPDDLLFLLTATRSGYDPEVERVLKKVLEQLPEAVARMNLTKEDRKVLARLLPNTGLKGLGRTGSPVRADLTIVGVMRDPTRHERLQGWEGLLANIDVLIPAEVADELFFLAPAHKNMVYGQVTVVIDRDDHLVSTQGRVREMGFETFSLADVVEEIRFTILVLSIVAAFMATVALVVAGLGITNTMLMSVLERTREIGIMKAVGARDRHVLAIFLIEGALIGLVGSALGALLGWLASFPGDQIAQSLIRKRTQLHLEGSLFVYPWWVMVGVPLLVTLLTTLAALYPARRAAQVNPIAALRHE